MKEGVIYEAPGYTDAQRKEFDKFVHDHEEVLRKRAKMTPEERAKQDKELEGLHKRMQSCI